MDSFTPLSKITELSSIKVRILRVWSKPNSPFSKFKQPTELILIDESGSKIEAQFKPKHVWKHKKNLNENATIILKHFDLEKVDGYYLFTNHTHKIFSNDATIVKACESFSDVTLYGHDFANFDMILSKQLQDKYLIDIIGEITEIGDVVSFDKSGPSNVRNKNTNMKRLIIKLENRSKTELSVTLWNDFAVEMSDAVKGFEGSRFIVILQSAKVVLFQGDITVSNSLFGTRLILDQGHPEIVEYLSFGCIEDSTATHTITHVTTYSGSSLADQFLQQNTMKMLYELTTINTEDTICVILANIIEFEDKTSWYYNACVNCTRGVSTDGEKFFCVPCDKQMDIAVLRYKLKIKVADVSGVASLMLIGRDVEAVINKSVMCLLENRPKDVAEDYFPEDLNMLLNQTFLFRIGLKGFFIQKGNCRHTVKKMTSDPEMIEKFKVQVSSKHENISEYSHSEKMSSVTASSSKCTPLKRQNSAIVSDEENGGVQASSTKAKISSSLEEENLDCIITSATDCSKVEVHDTSTTLNPNITVKIEKCE